MTWVIGALAVIVGWSLLAGGVYLLAGLPWTLMCASVPFLGFAFFLFRGLTNAVVVNE